MTAEEFLKDKSNQQTNVKCETLEKGPKRKYTHKSKADEKAKEMIGQMINEQTNEQTNEPMNRQIIEEKYDECIRDLINSEGDLEKRLANQQLAYRLEKNGDDNIFLEIIQPLAELYMQEQDSKTIIERVKDAMTNSVNYTKICQQESKKQQITGKLIDFSLMDEDNLCIVDIDIHKDKSIEEIDKIRQNLIDSLPSNVGLVKTVHGRLHIYCDRNNYRLPSNRNVKVAVTDSFDIDQHDRIYGVQINDEGAIEQMNDELAQACVDWLKNLEMHNYPQPINMDGSLLSIFCGLNGINNETIRADGLGNIRKFNKLSANADKNYGQASSNGERKPNPWILTKILRYHNQDYYEQIIKPLLKKNYEAKKMEKQILINQTLIQNKIDLTDDFTLLDMQENAANGEYENEEQIVMDLTRLLVYYEGETEDIYAIKGYDAICDIQKGCKFISEDPKILTVFQGYNMADTNPEKKFRAAIVLQSRQRIGKNRFTDVIAELTSRYSCSNITNIDEFTGRFNSVVENKMFAVLNEMMNYNYSKKGVATVMKSIISDLTIRINEKNQPKRIAEKVMNIIYVTNADMPVQLDTDDRRHLVRACKTVHQVSEERKEDIEYFNELSQSHTQEFYENLMTFLLERDISQFNPTLIPMTEAKKYLINVSRSLIDDVIMEHYEQFNQGIPIALVNQCKPQNWQLKTYKNAMIHKYIEQTPRINGLKTRIYKLNEDQLRYYDKMMSEEDIETSNANYQKYKKTIEDNGFIDQVLQETKEE
ncbi:MAG: hypothetical protein EZS28_022858 [Streblomastix strix]|uniref:NrS-1 polymerase-like helicase domain-containing protein n=1 Tax=Streblomastix strix TaxID=222440 RepID=A0A5J4VGK6_9EUKA|nr:MAG: hypothetical protein EZS28_022858 [Streblomastix strix]